MGILGIIGLVFCSIGILSLIYVIILNLSSEETQERLMSIFHKEYRKCEKEKVKKVRELEAQRKKKIFENGTDDEKVELINETASVPLNLDGTESDLSKSILLKDSEVKELYKGLDFSKVEMVLNPSFIYNIDEKKVLQSMIDTHEVIDNPDGSGNKIFQIKPGNRITTVDNYEHKDMSFINELNKCEKIIIYREKNPVNIYRYKIIDGLK